jgi:hypothetical protein
MQSVRLLFFSGGKKMARHPIARLKSLELAMTALLDAFEEDNIFEVDRLAVGRASDGSKRVRAITRLNTNRDLFDEVENDDTV